MLFILTIALQASGALILLFGSLACRKDNLIKDCVPGSNFFERDENNMCIIPASTLRMKGKRKYRNVAGFINMSIGYLLSALSPAPTCTSLHNFLLVIIFSVLIIGMTEFCIEGIARCLLSKDELVPYETLEKHGADSPIANEEIDAFFT